MKKKCYQAWETLKNHPELQGNFVRWGIFLALLIIVSMWLIEPYLDWRQQQLKVIIANKRQVSKLIALQASTDKWQQALQTSKKQIQQNHNAFVHADSYILAQQQMNHLIQALIKQHQLKLSSQALQDVEETPFGEKIGLQFNLGGEMLNIIAFIDAITRTPQLLTIEQLTIAKTRYQAIIRITLAGYRLKNRAIQHSATK